MILKEKAEKMSPEELSGKILIGEFVEEDRMSYIQKKELKLKEICKP